MTLRAYQTLYETSVAFGMRKALMAEQGKTELEAKVRHFILGNIHCHYRFLLSSVRTTQRK